MRQYLPLIDAGLAAEIQDLAARLRDVRLLHLNSTAYGGGVAELSMSLVGLEEDLDLSVAWRTIGGDEKFFKVTKGMHNALQGKARTLTDEARAIYLQCNETCAHALEDAYDAVIVHDPQPAAIRHFAGGRGARWIWRCRIDTSSPNPSRAGRRDRRRRGTGCERALPHAPPAARRTAAPHLAPGERRCLTPEGRPGRTLPTPSWISRRGFPARGRLWLRGS